MHTYKQDKEQRQGIKIYPKALLCKILLKTIIMVLCSKKVVLLKYLFLKSDIIVSVPSGGQKILLLLENILIPLMSQLLGLWYLWCFKNSFVQRKTRTKEMSVCHKELCYTTSSVLSMVCYDVFMGC